MMASLIRSHLKNEEGTPLGSGPGGAGLTDGSSVYVERGAPLGEEDGPQ